MKTLEDYYHQTLGISLKIPVKTTLSKTLHGTKRSQAVHTLSKEIYFIADAEDLKQNKDMVLKILKSINKGQDILKNSKDLPQLTGEVFNFGTESDKQSTQARLLDWPRLTAISKNIDLKRQLWNELKKRS